MLYAVCATQRSRSFHRRSPWRLCLGGYGAEGEPGLNRPDIDRSARGPRPAFAAAQRADAAFHPQHARTGNRNVAGVGVAVVGVVDATRPLVRTGREHSREERKLGFLSST